MRSARPDVRWYRLLAVVLLGALLAPPGRADDGAVPHPDWFKTGFYDLPADLAEAREAGKTGLLLFFHTPACSYCKALLRTTFADPKVVTRLRGAFDVIALDVLSDTEVTGLDGTSYWAKEFAVHERATFTPTLVFYGGEGERLLRLVGYQSPERFRAVLDYLRQGTYEQRSLRAFLAERAPPPSGQGAAPIPDDPLFMRPPLVLDRRAAPADRPLFVLFQRPGCEPCERFNRVALGAPSVRGLLERFEVVGLDMHDATGRVLTPAGAKTSPQGWADSLGLLHAPAMVFFDQEGNEVVRVDSELLVDARGEAVRGSDPQYVENVAARLRYVLEKGYLDQPQFQQWRARGARRRGE